jgi:glycosyltransferase involved in cell wall biosynthesis
MSPTQPSARHYGTRRIVVILSGWPRLSESFALNELLALHAAGMLAAVFATKSGDASSQHPAVATLDPFVRHLAPGTVDEQAAEVVDALAGTRVDGVHGYFAHQPAAVARCAADALGVPFGFSVHAKDPRKVQPDELTDRSRAAACIVACNCDVAEQLRSVGADPILVPHGVDLGSFTLTPRVEDGPLQLLAVGRLVAKKGFDHLIDAVRLLDIDWRLRFVGDGPLLADLQRQATAAGVAGRIAFVGTRTHAELPALYHSADVVVVPSVIDGDGDRDGLPNVVLEAMASGRAVVASDVAAIPTAIEHGITGLLVRPGDVEALAAAIARLADDRSLAAALGASARARAEAEFGLPACTDRFLSILEAAYV